MKIERLRKSHKKQVVIGVVAICVVGGALTFNLTKAKYKLTESIPLVRGTVNYKAYDFKVMAMYKSEDGTNYTEITDRMPSSGYVINESKSYCTLDNKNKDTAVRLYTNSSGEHIIKNLAKSDKCYLYFDVKPITIPDIIAASKKGSGTPTFSKTSCTSGCEEATVGTYAVNDGMYGGTSTYWRGDPTDNYVKFANKCWRIVRINGDGSIRLIHDGSTCHANGTSTADSIAVASQKYNASYIQSNYVGWTYDGTSQRTLSGTNSNAKSQIESWYSTNLASYATKIADGKYCNDRNVQSGNTWTIKGNDFYYAAYKRIYTDHAPTLSCSSGDIYTLKVGLITVDEAMYAGGRDTTNQKYYLYNGQNYWTISPYYWNDIRALEDDSGANMFRVDANGNLANNYAGSTSGLRPVINLKSDTKFSGGNGTLSSPYIVN